MNTSPKNAPESPEPGAAKNPAKSSSSRCSLRCGVTVLGVLLTALIWVAIWLELRHDHQDSIADGSIEATNLAIAMAETTDATVRAIDTALRLMRREYIASPGRMDRFAGTIAKLRDSSMAGIALQFGLIDAQGVLRFVDPANSRVPLDVSDRAHFRAHLENTEDHLYVGAPFVTRTTNRWALQFTRPMRAADGALLGVVSILVAPEHFTNLYSKLQIGERGEVELIRDGGIVMARGTPRAPAVDPVGKRLPDWQVIEHGRLIMEDSPLDGVRRLVAHRRLATLPLTVQVGLAEDELLAVHRKHGADLMLVGGTATLALALAIASIVMLASRLEASRRSAAASEARLRGIVENVHAVTWEMDAASRRFSYVAPQVERMFGYPAGDWLAKDFWLDHVHPDDREAVLRHRREATLRGEDHDAEYRFLASDGRVFWLRDIVNLAPDPRGSPAKLTGVMVDISRQKQAEQALAREKSLLRGLLDTIPDLIFFKDVEGIYMGCNAAVLKLIGLSEEEELIGRTDHAFFAHEQAEFFRRNDQAMLAAGVPRRNEEWVAYPDGRKVLLDTIKAPFFGEEGRPYGVIGVSRDITAMRAVESELRRSEEKFRSYVELSADGICVFGTDGRLRSANESAARMLGYGVDQLVSMSIRDFAAGPDARARLDAVTAELRSSGRCRLVHAARRSDGAVIQLEASGALLPDDSYLCTWRDITERVRQAESLRLAKTVFDAVSEGIMVTSPDGTILSVNPAFGTVTGWPAAEVLGKTPKLLSSGRHDTAFYQQMWRSLRGEGQWQGEIWNRRRDGEVYVAWLAINAVRDAAGVVTHYVAIFGDITERKRQQEEIWRQANFDGLTGLANRHQFLAQLEQALAGARRRRQLVGLLFIDLDRFKWVNDKLGHAAGDRLLAEAAQRLRACTREEDVVARLGGDEFTVLIQGLAESDALALLAKKIIAALGAPFDLGGSLQSISASVGITVFPNDGDSVEDLMRNADNAMYRAKEAGRNCYEFFSPELQAEARRRSQIERALRGAVERGEFELHYQPIVDADSGELVGVEALLRWPDPLFGTTQSGDFIAVAEDCGLIVPIGEWVIESACRQWREWIDPGRDPPYLAINVSGIQFRSPALADRLAAALTRYGLGDRGLNLELTESTLGAAFDELPDRLARIQQLGVRFTLDDFGTGSTALAHLQRFPISLVKIDRSLIARCPGELAAVHVVEASIFMAQSMGLQVIAEGVEKENQRSFLRDLGCNYLQGYLAGEPVPAAEFEAYLHRGKLLETPYPNREAARFLSALRDRIGDPREWLQRLAAERFPALIDGEPVCKWMLDGLVLGDIVVDHLDSLGQLDGLAASASVEGLAESLPGGHDGHCELGRWLAAQQANRRASAALTGLERAHREFHRQAAAVAEEILNGRRAEARRRMRMLDFRQTSCALVLALIDVFGERRGPAG